MYKEIFLRVCKVYVTRYPEHSFRFIFDGKEQELIGNSSETITVRMHNTEKVFKRIFSEGSIGLGESYCEGNIEVEDQEYKQFIFIFVRIAFNKKLIWKLSFLDIIRIMRAPRSMDMFFTNGTHEADINSHYSLSDWFDNREDSNAFYLIWLNARYIQYSCGKWDRLTKTLEEAQVNKLEFYAKRLGIFKKSEGKTLLDLGCGWGGMMFYMAETYSIRCKGLTLSVAQADYVNKEIQKRGLEDLVSVEVKNIHDMEGKYDYITSVGVMEHITDYEDLYKKVSVSLNEEGKALIHSIFHPGKEERIVDPFLSKYIFPGGGIPQLKKNLEIFDRHFGYVDANELPQKSYPKTLECWFIAFCRNEKEIRKLLEEKSKVRDVDYAIRVYKHYFTSAYCGFYEDELIVNVLAYN